MASSNGWVGKILKINLSNGIISKEDTEYYEPEKFIGGRGLTAKIFWDNIDAKTHLMLRDNPWAPESLIAIASGPATGTLAPTSGRVQLGGVAPQGYPKPAYTRSGMGGNFGPELKYAGYDGLYVVGKAEQPVYVVIENDKVEIKDAQRVTLKNGRPATQGVCPVCSTKVFRIGQG